MADGEGASKFITVKIFNCKTEQEAKQIAFSIANSPLVKTAIAGEDPNWGRILSAAGNTENKFQEKNVSIKMGDIKVMENGEIHKKYREALGKKEFKKKRISIAVKLGSSKHSAKVKSSDLTHEYISINSDYRS